MGYFIVTLVGFFGGATLVYFLLDQKRRNLAQQEAQLESQGKLLHARQVELENREQYYGQQYQSFSIAKSQFDQLHVTYTELFKENHVLKADLNNLYQQLRKTQLDNQSTQNLQLSIDAKVTELGAKYLKDQVKWIESSLNANNYATCKQKLADAVFKIRDIGITVTNDEEARLYSDLKHEYELVVRAALEREEQARIRAQIKEEQKLELAVQRALEQAAREKQIVEAALAEALLKAQGEHTEEIDLLKAKLAEAEAKSARAISQAQLTKSGNVYVISNIGSFGDEVFKIGMTRRLDPLDRVNELGDASVPFPFDIHMMIATQDAPSLENALHRAFHKRRINKVNLRKEYFRVKLDEIVSIVKKNHGDVTYRADAEALQYRNSLLMTDQDLEMLEEAYEEEDEEQGVSATDVE